MRKKSGPIESTLLKWFTKPGRIGAVTPVSEHFRFVDMEGDGLRGHAFAAGHKLQLRLEGMSFRTYTPLFWDGEQGRTRFLAYVHDDSPATRWINRLEAGSEILFHGPKPSLDTGTPENSLLLFGDETSFGLAASLRMRANAGQTPRHVFVFEVTSKTEAQAVLDQLGIEAVLIERRDGDSHLDILSAAFDEAADRLAPDLFMLTGKATTIQHLRKSLKTRGVLSARLRNKAYWAPGKTGLD